MFVVYPETAFGGVFETEAVYQSTKVQDLVNAGDGWMLWPPIPFSYDTLDLHTEGAVAEAPRSRHWLGPRELCPRHPVQEVNPWPMFRIEVFHGARTVDCRTADCAPRQLTRSIMRCEAAHAA